MCIRTCLIKKRWVDETRKTKKRGDMLIGEMCGGKVNNWLTLRKKINFSKMEK